MKELPDWWLTASGTFFILGAAAMLVLVGVLGYLVKVIADLRNAMLALSARVEKLTDKADAIAEQVKTVTTEVGARTTGLVRMVDDVASPAITIVERFAPALLGLAAVVRIFNIFKARARH